MMFEKIVLFIFKDNSFFYALGTLIAGLSGLFALTKQLQMFQQNSYFPRRYLSWLMGNEKKYFFVRVIIFALYCFINLRISGFYLLVIVGLLTVSLICRCVISKRVQKASVIPLKFTARIKRMYGVFAFLIVALALFQYFLLGTVSYWGMSFSILLCIFPYISVILLWALLYPVEKAVTKHYINDAKKILASYNGRLKVIGITGSYGKTGTKMILGAMLKEKYNTLVTPKNYNTTMGVVITVRQYLKPQTEIFVCEMGAKKTGDIKEICDLVNPDSAIITTVGPQHLDTFGSIENVFSTKFELYDSVENKGGITFACGDSEEIRKGAADKNVILYGSDPSFDYYADNITCSSKGVTFDLHLKGETVEITTKLLGRHNVLNIVGSAAIAHTYGVSPQSIKFAVSRLSAPEHRLEIKRYACGSTLIDDAYNSNPVGCLEACRVLSQFAPMKRVLITPGLVELGAEEYKHNFRLGEVASECADYIILVGNERSKPIKEGILSKDFNEERLFTAASFKEAYEKYLTLADSDTVVLIENDLPDNYLK